MPKQIFTMEYAMHFNAFRNSIVVESSEAFLYWPPVSNVLQLINLHFVCQLVRKTAKKHFKKEKGIEFNYFCVWNL